MRVVVPGEEEEYPTFYAHAPCFHLWPAQLYNISPLFLIKGTIFEEKNIEQELCF